MGFLYSFGYDFGSAMVHPMADDGQEDFHLVTGLPSRRPHVDQRVVLHNSVLCAAMVANEVLSEVGFLWRRPATEFLHDLSASLVTGDDRYRASLGRVEAFGLTNPIGRPRPEGPP
jgi:hypothetical protein